jgi:hypothetical protein
MKLRYGSDEVSVNEEKKLQEVNLRFSESCASLAGLYNQPPPLQPILTKIGPLFQHIYHHLHRS